MHNRVSKDHDGISLIGYETGFNSLGVIMKYELNECLLLSTSEIINIEQKKTHIMDQCLHSRGIYNSGKEKDNYRLILIGDSVMRGEEGYIKRIMSGAANTNIKIRRISTEGGLYLYLNNTIAELEKLRLTKPNEKRILLFNSGLHDVDKMCSGMMRLERKKMGIETDHFVCLNEYRKLLNQLVAYIGQYPADLKVFRSTTAGWMRYGNFGFAWNLRHEQGFVRSPNFVAKINEIAYDVIKSSEYQIHVIDGYWITLPRPDNTEVSKENKAGKHMVHPGMAVYIEMCRRWLTLIMRHMCNNVLEDIDSKSG